MTGSPQYRNFARGFCIMGKRLHLLFITAILSIGFLPIPQLQARALFDVDDSAFIPAKPQYDEPCVGVGVHNKGKIGLTVSNQGHFGTGFFGGATNPLDGGIAPSCIYPYPGRSNYLFAGAFWIGAVVGIDTLVSVGADGWHGTKELWPLPCNLGGGMVYRSISRNDSLAVSEQDWIAVYTDTVTDAAHVAADPLDGRPHIPLGIQVTQRTYGWSYAYAEDFVLFDYSIKNIGQKDLKKVYMGIYVDGDVSVGVGGEGYLDDISGFKQAIPSPLGCGFIDTINIAWLADNDGLQAIGDPCPYDPGNSVTGIMGTRVVRTPSDSLKYSFNWWISNSEPSADFGPRRIGTADDPFRSFGGNLGTPEGDKNKYYIMRHEEFDYDELFTAVDHSADGWLPPPRDASDFADGFDTRYLLSFGPFDIRPGEVLPLSFAQVCGENFHTDCNAFKNLFNAAAPDAFYNQLNFQDFGLNATWASWLYDNPGYDTDGDGYKGKFRVCVFDSTLKFDTIQYDPVIVETTTVYLKADTSYYEGDGVPDFRGATPPPAPKLWVYPSLNEFNEGEIRVRWNGTRSETEKDVFSQKIDFEGYRLYTSLTPVPSAFILTSSYDLNDYEKHIWNAPRQFFEVLDPPFSLDSLQKLYGQNFDPLKYDRDNLFFWSDSTFYFTKKDWNQSDLSNPTAIHKIYPDQPPPTTLNVDSAKVYYPEELTADGYFKYYEYEFTIKHLLPSQLYYIAVTAFDYGSPGKGLESLETSPTSNMISEYAQNNANVVEDNNLKVVVYPNPYRGDAHYGDSLGGNFEGRGIDDSRRSADRLHRIHFANLPHQCTIRIYTLDGDLVRQIDHDVPEGSPMSGTAEWDMITRNTQAVVSGIYYYVVESKYGNQIGKLVIIL
ncbi:conserved hypothetical protein [Candidatus Zixiibacteriota bacterium]|nr:conserved hypothetical protein [candidate division Zixibacteria bacterium]